MFPGKHTWTDNKVSVYVLCLSLRSISVQFMDFYLEISQIVQNVRGNWKTCGTIETSMRQKCQNIEHKKNIKLRG